MKRRVCISILGDLKFDARVQKSAQSLFDAGYEVTVIYGKRRVAGDFKPKYKTEILKTFFRRSAFFYAEFNLRLFFRLLFKKTDILLANDLDTLLANFLVAKIRGKKLVYDSHELFCEVPELEGRKFVKKCWLKIEKFCLPKIKNAYTVCQSIADYYGEKYGVEMRVVRNMPPFSAKTPCPTRLNFHGKKIILYQGRLNLKRAIEPTLRAMKFIDEAVLVIAGSGDCQENLRALSVRENLQEKVFFLGEVSREKLPNFTAQAAVGLCLLEESSLSYFYALPNRIFDFIQAGVPVLASDFPEISKIVNSYKIGQTIDCLDPQKIATALKSMLSAEKNEENFLKAKTELTWEREEKVILEIFKNL